MKHEAFKTGNFDTNFVETHFKPALLERPTNKNEALIAALLAIVAQGDHKPAQEQNKQTVISQWKKNRL
jgi:propionyl-CoA carboxylase alpha chain